MIAGVDPPALNPARLYCEGRITGFRGWRGGSSGTLMVTSLPERGSRNGRGILTPAVHNGPTANPHFATPMAVVLNSTSTGAICLRTSNKSSKPSTKMATTSCWKPANSAPAMFRDDCVTAFGSQWRSHPACWRRRCRRMGGAAEGAPHYAALSSGGAVPSACCVARARLPSKAGSS